MNVFTHVILPIFGGLILLFCLYLVLIRTRRPRKEAESFARCHYAHRGLWGEGVAENSLTAFRLAAERGIAVEMDVQLSRDGVPVVFHDPLLDRVTGMEGAVRDYDAATLATFRLSGTEDTVPTFAEVLSVIGGRCPILLEIKSDAGWRAVAEAVLPMIREYEGPLCIESFHPLAVRFFRRRAPEVVRGFLWARHFRHPSFRRPSYFLVWLMVFNCLMRPDFIAASAEDLFDFPILMLRLFHKTGYLAWTVRDEETYRAVIPYVHGVIFEGFLPPS